MAIKLGRRFTLLKESELGDVRGYAAKKNDAVRVTDITRTTLRARPVVGAGAYGGKAHDIIEVLDDDKVRLRGVSLSGKKVTLPLRAKLEAIVEDAILGQGGQNAWRRSEMFQVGDTYKWKRRIRFNEQGNFTVQYVPDSQKAKNMAEAEDGCFELKIDNLDTILSRWPTYSDDPVKITQDMVVGIVDDKLYARVEGWLAEVENVSPGSMNGMRLFVGSGSGEKVNGLEVVERTAFGNVYSVPFSKRRAPLRDKLFDKYLTASQRDARKMSAGPSYHNALLSDDQNRCVSAHLNTQFGYVNALSTGDGKTISTLVSFNERVRAHTDALPWRGLVIMEAGVRDQWAGESAAWLDEGIETMVVKTRRDAEKLELVLNGTAPVLVLCSYALVSDVGEEETRLGQVLANTVFDDVALDEGRTIRGSGKTARALWSIREKADRAVVLCATPVLKSAMDLGRLMAWARKDRTIASKHLTKVFAEMKTKDDLSDWYTWWGPALLRSSAASRITTRKNLGLDKPTVVPSVISITPSDEEMEISNLVMGSIKETLSNIIAAYKTTGGKLDQEEERRLRGAVLATNSVARQASSDVRALADSEAVTAELLRAQGVLNFKDDYVPAKFAWCVRTCLDQVKAGKPVVVFTEYRATAHMLAEALEEAGLRTVKFIGGGSKKRDAGLKAFRDGERDVMIATSAAERGLNLPNARCLIHYDMKFTPDVIFQRTGRITRLASDGGEVDILFPVTMGTIDERVFSVAVARAGLAGATAAESVEDFVTSTEGLILAEIAPYAKRSALPKNGTASMLELTKALVS